MRVMLDSNILISATILRSEQIEKFIKKIKNHTVVLTNLITEESLAVINRKFPHKTDAFKQFLSELSFDFSFIANDVKYDYDIRDEFDKKILHSAYSCSVDILITGDKDFFEKEYDGLEILTITEFLKKY